MPSNPPPSFARRLRELMLKHGHVQPRNPHEPNASALARAARVTPEQGSRYIEGVAIPRAATLERIATWLGTTPSHLLYGDATGPTDIDAAALACAYTEVLTAANALGYTLAPERLLRVAIHVYQARASGNKITHGMLRSLLNLID